MKGLNSQTVQSAWDAQGVRVALQKAEPTAVPSSVLGEFAFTQHAAEQFSLWLITSLFCKLLRD